MGRKTTLEERMMIVRLAEAGHVDREIAELLRCSKETVRKWRQQWKRQGRSGLSSPMGRPKTGALSGYPSEIVDTLRAWRQAHPGWGPKTLLTELEGYKPFAGQSLPASSSIARWLSEEKLTRPYERHSELPNVLTPVSQRPHEEWEIDARGHQYVPDVGVIALINLNDVFSKVKLLSYPCWLGEKRASRHPTTEDYQLVIRLAGMEWGLPERLAADHDSVFFDNTTKSPFPTRFHLWLLALSISLSFGRKGRPTDQATTERSHQTWYHQVLQAQQFVDWEALWRALNDRRQFLNERLPCASCNDLPPLKAHPQARHSCRYYRPEQELELLDLTKVWQYLSQGQWFRKVSKVGTVSLGGQVYILGRTWAQQQMEITFSAEQKLLIFHSANGATTTQPIQGITPAELVGELGQLAHYPAFQLALPLSWEEARVVRLYETLVQ